MASMLLILIVSSWFGFEPIFILFQEEDYDVPEELEDIIGWFTISFSLKNT